MLLYRMAVVEPQSRLLALPDPCLLVVLQCCAADSHHSLFSAARSHSRLHQAAVLALRSIRAEVPGQLQLDSVMLYLRKHWSNVDRIFIRGPKDRHVTRHHLPTSLQISSLHLERISLQLGVLGAAAALAALKQLQLESCSLVGIVTAGVTEAFSQLLMWLDHLSVVDVFVNAERTQFPTSVFQQQQQQQQQQLTYLELAGVRLQGPDEASPALQPLQALTGLVDLRLHKVIALDCQITDDMLSGMHGLTCLDSAGGTDD